MTFRSQVVLFKKHRHWNEPQKWSKDNFAIWHDSQKEFFALKKKKLNLNEANFNMFASCGIGGVNSKWENRFTS